MFAPLLRRSTSTAASAAAMRARTSRVSATVAGVAPAGSAPRLLLRSTVGSSAASRALSSLATRSAATTSLRGAMNTPRSAAPLLTASASRVTTGLSATLPRPYTLSALLRFNSTAAAAAATTPAVATASAPAATATTTTTTTAASGSAPPVNLSQPLPAGAVDAKAATAATAPGAPSAGPFVDPVEAASHSMAAAPANPSVAIDAMSKAAEVAVPPEWYYLPVTLMQDMLTALHATYGMPWWGAIAAATIALRLLVLPLNIFQQKVGANMSYMKPDLDRWNAERQQLMVAGKFNDETQAHMMNQYKAIQEKHGAGGGILRMMGSILITFPLFITMFVSLRNFQAFGPTFAHEGMLWFVNLTVPDPLMLLPLLTAVSTAASVRWGSDSSANTDPAKKRMINIFTAASLLMFFVTKTFPAGICWYWFVTNMMSVSTGLILRQPAVRKMLGIRTPYTAPANAPRSAYSPQSFATAALPSESKVAKDIAEKTAKDAAPPFVPIVRHTHRRNLTGGTPPPPAPPSA